MILRTRINGFHFHDAHTEGKSVLCAFVTWIRRDPADYDKEPRLGTREQWAEPVLKLAISNSSHEQTHAQLAINDVVSFQLLSDDRKGEATKMPARSNDCSAGLPAWLRLKLSVNGHVLGVAGIDTFSVLNTILTWRRALSERDALLPENERLGDDQMLLYLGGGPASLESETRCWIDQIIEKGDMVVVEILPPGDITPPTSITTSTCSCR